MEMEKVLDRLKYYAEQVDIKERYLFSFETDDEVLTPDEQAKLDAINNLYDKNVKLKWILNRKYEEGYGIELDFWIINKWGGIKGFKKNERNISKIKEFKEQLKVGRLTRNTFGTISSLSKLASFMHPEDYVIYDSRVIYSLNWLLLTTENKDGLKNLYFPTPIGRNKIITGFDMNTIINLFNVDAYQNKTPLYNSYKDAYFKFSRFMKYGAKEIYGEDAKPYQLEMLLFTLADEEVFEEMMKKILVEISN